MNDQLATWSSPKRDITSKSSLMLLENVHVPASFSEKEWKSTHELRVRLMIYHLPSKNERKFHLRRNSVHGSVLPRWDRKANGIAVIIPIPHFPFKANSQVENTSEHYKNVRNLLPNIFIDRGKKNEIKDTSSVNYVFYTEFVFLSLI